MFRVGMMVLRPLCRGLSQNVLRAGLVHIVTDWNGVVFLAAWFEMARVGRVGMANRGHASLNGGTSGSLHGRNFVPYGLCNRGGSTGNTPRTVSFTIPFARLHGVVCAPRMCMVGLVVSNRDRATVVGRVRFRPAASTPLRISFCRIGSRGPVAVNVPIGLMNLTRNMHSNNHVGLSVHGVGIATPCRIVPRRLSVSIARLGVNGDVGMNSLSFRNLRLTADGTIMIYSVGVAHGTRLTTRTTARRRRTWSVIFGSFAGLDGTLSGVKWVFSL